MTSQFEKWEDRFLRPHRIALFGYRGVGKTTLLTMLYREAAAGRLDRIRLAAGDARTAQHLAERIQLIESEGVLAGTLAETELRLHLYCDQARLELLVKDYQGEHVDLGRDEEILDHLRKCDAILLCLGADVLSSSANLLKRQQEFEQLVESYLVRSRQPSLAQPVALVLTKADLLGDRTEVATEACERQIPNAIHTLRTHVRHHAILAVSSLDRARSTPTAIATRNLDGLVHWLSGALRWADEQSLQSLFERIGTKTSALAVAASVFARRYPGSPMAGEWLERAAAHRKAARRRRRVFALAGAASLVGMLGSYDIIGYVRASRIEAAHKDDPVAVLKAWQDYQGWHPIPGWISPGAARSLDSRIAELTHSARLADLTRELQALSLATSDPDSDPVRLWQLTCDLRVRYPEAADMSAFREVRRLAKERKEQRDARVAQTAYEQLLLAESKDGDLTTLISQADAFLQDYPETTLAREVRTRRSTYVARIDEKGIEAARSYSARQPLNFQSRKEAYQRYLDRHPAGQYADEAREALRRIDDDWDKHDYRRLRDHFVANPGHVSELVNFCQGYLTLHPSGRFASSVQGILRWTERVTVPGEYRVVLRSGEFEKSIARFFSRGPDLSVELEVAGVRYGPSTIVVNEYRPQWEFEFPRRIRWQLGDPVRIRVTDHDYADRAVVDIASEPGDMLAMRYLSGQTWSGHNGLTFESDFALPLLAEIE